MPTFQRTAHRLLVVVVLLTAVALFAASSAAAQCGQEYRGAPKSSTIPGGPPLAIGDSVLADAVPELVGYGFEADGMVCRQMSQGLAILRERSGHLPHLVVLALGTNGEVSDSEIAEALRLLGPERVLVLVTPHGAVVPSTVAVIRAATASSRDRIVLLDWDRLAGEHKDWLAPDGVHLGGSAGINGFAAMIASTLRYAVPASVEPEGADVDPGTPETLPSPPIHHRRARREAHSPAKAPTTPSPGPQPATKSSESVAAIAPHPMTSAGSSAPSPALIAGVVAAVLALALAVMRLVRHRRAARRGS